MDIGALLSDRSPWLIGQDSPQWRLRERRDLQQIVLDRVRDLGTRRATIVLGPRQVGKSVLLLQTAEDLLRAGWPPHRVFYFDFKDDRIVEPISVRDVIAAADGIRDSLPTRPDSDVPTVLLLDEVSQAPRWDRWLKGAVDEGSYRVVATDSAASLLRDGSRESGLGRWDELLLEGLTFDEFRRLASREVDPLTRFLRVGGFPEYASGIPLDDARHRLREDIAYRAVERDLAAHIDAVDEARRLFVYLIQDSGAIYNASQRSQDLGVDRKKLSQWTQLFFDSRLIVPLPRRSLNARGEKAKAARRLGAHPKLYAVDHGLIHAFSPLPNPYGDPDVRGQVFESLVFRHLRALVAADGSLEASFHRQGTEGDFVVDTADGPIVLEVTSAASAGGKIKKIKKIAKTKTEIGAERAVLVYGGLDARDVSGVSVVPLPMFLENPANAVFGGAS